MEDTKKEIIPDFIPPDLLPDNHTITVKEEVRINYTSEQVAEMKDRHFEISLHKENRESLIDAMKALVTSDISREMIVEGIKEITVEEVGDKSIKELKAEFKKSIKVINQGYIVEQTVLYGFAYPEIRRMAFFLPSGDYHHDRPIKATEMQLTTMGSPVIPIKDSKTA